MNTQDNKDEAARLKKFMLENFDFQSLKQMGFWAKGTRSTDHEKQASRICEYFGYQSVYEYNPPYITMSASGKVAIAESVGSVNASGEYEPGTAALISTFQSEFVCPICSCPQQIKDSSKQRQRCKGCKRPLVVAIGLTGDLHVWELAK